jgi:choline/glycine/proline betaine transport protein
LEGTVAIALLVLAAGEEGLEALQTAAIMAALPVSVVIILMCVAIWRQLHAERLAMVRAERRRRSAELTAQVSQDLLDRGLVTVPVDSEPAASPPAAGPDGREATGGPPAARPKRREGTDRPGVDQK